MRTGRSLTICCSLLPGGGVSPWSRGGFSLVPGGSAWSGEGEVLPGLGGGVLLGPGGVCLVQGGVCLVPRGVSAWSRGGCLPGPRVGSPETPPVNRITDTCKNITLATTSLRPVITILNSSFRLLNVWYNSVQTSMWEADLTLRCVTPVETTTTTWLSSFLLR